jgi:hypothetical protein
MRPGLESLRSPGLPLLQLLLSELELRLVRR